ncbi:MAG TPA: hypothetical protein VN922_23960 [Bacteroidia bacterium]|nr:hypothetical protein [Bacteroidia bacterium]
MKSQIKLFSLIFLVSLTVGGMTSCKKKNVKPNSGGGDEICMKTIKHISAS